MSLSLSSSPFEIDFKTVQHFRTLTTLKTAGAQSKRSSAKTRQAHIKLKLLIENDCQKVRSFQKIIKIVQAGGWVSCVPEEESEVKDRSALFIHLDEKYL